MPAHRNPRAAMLKKLPAPWGRVSLGVGISGHRLPSTFLQPRVSVGEYPLQSPAQPRSVFLHSFIIACRILMLSPWLPLSVDGRGRVVYQYKQRFRDGSTHVVLEPLDFIARLAALVPRPQIDRFVIRASIWWTTPRTFVAGTLDIASTSEPSICCLFGK